MTFGEVLTSPVVNSLKRRYILVLFLLALCTLGGFFLLNEIVLSQQASAAEINVAGRQRMLSQKMSLLAQRLADETDVEERNRSREELKHYAQLMRDSHEGLTKGSETLGLTPPRSPELTGLYFGPVTVFDKDIREFIDDVERLLAATGENTGDFARYTEDIYMKSRNLLPNLDLIVYQYQMDSDKRVKMLQNIQWLTFGSILILLFVSGLMSRRIELDMAEIDKAGLALREKSKSISLMENIAVVANESKNVDETIKTCLDMVCSYTGWPIGHYYAPAYDGTGDLVPTSIWHLEHPEQFETFRKVTEETRFAPGIGLPGRVLSSGKPLWVVDVSKDANFPRAKLAEDIGVRAGLAFPIKVGEKVAGVLEFFSDEISEPDLYELDIMAQIGTQLGRVVERKQAEEELQKLSRAVESSSASVIMTDRNGIIEYVNPKFTEVTGYSREEVIGENPRLLKSNETPDLVYVDMWETISSGGEWKGKLHNRKKGGSLYWCSYSISGVKDINGEITHYIAIQEDVTHEYELSEQLGYQANHDALTGLVNRREFERRAERLLSSIRQDKGEHALCFMDLDQFKVVNDTCGHAAGDEMLRQISMILQQEVRKRDTLARLGGDEFGVLMEHCTPEKAHRVATSLQKAIQDYQFSWEEHVFKVGVSIGLVPITEAMPNLIELMKQADAACYMAKDMGRNRIHVYHGEDQDLAKRHGEMQWVERIHQALEEDRFCLYAQPIVQLNGHTDEHYELLIRMKDESGEFILPGAFLPAAERYNLITQLDRWVIENTLTLLTENRSFLEQIHFFSINLSGQSLAEESFLDFIVSQLDTSGIDGNKICFEITETAAISNLSSAIKFISTLKGLGCRFALDDFGSGLSSFGYLKNLPVDYLKIDGMFVKDMVDDPIDHAMVKSINDIAQVMGMQTIAEFVENDEIKGMLREIGVNYAQGHGIGKPLSFDELLGRSNNVTYMKDAESNKVES